MEVSFLPNWVMKYLCTDIIRQYQLNILLSNILVLLLFLIFKNSIILFLNQLPHFCLFDKLIGVECPFCGMTRAFCEISNTNFINAYRLNVASFFVISFFICQIPLRVFSFFKNEYIIRINLISKYFSNIVFAIVLANWVLNLFLKYYN